MKFELESYNIEVNIPDEFCQEQLELYFGTERHVKETYIAERNQNIGSKDTGVSGPEYNGIVARTVDKIGWLKHDKKSAEKIDPRAVAWVSLVVQREVLKYAVVPKV